MMEFARLRSEYIMLSPIAEVSGIVDISVHNESLVLDLDNERGRGANDSSRCESGEILHSSGMQEPYERIDRGVILTDLQTALECSDLAKIKNILDQYAADTEFRDSSGFTLLHHAAKFGRRKIVELFLQNRAGIDMRSSVECMTPLHIAVKEGQIDIMHCLIQNGADMTAQDVEGQTALHYAAKYGVSDLFLYLPDVEGLEDLINSIDRKGKTALHYAIVEKDIIVIEILLENNANAELIDVNGNTILHLAAFTNSIAIIKLLAARCTAMQSENFLNHENVHHLTPFQVATVYGNIKSAKTLLQFEKVKFEFPNKVDNEMIDMRVMFPFHKAAAERKESIVRYFINKSVPLDIKDLFGFTPVMEAINSGQEAIVRLLIKAGSNIQLRDFDLKTCLHIAIEKNHMSILEILLNNSKEYLINSQDKDYLTPFHYAAKFQNWGAMKMLLDVTCYIGVSHRGKNPLHFAAESGSLDCIKLLLDETQLDVNSNTKDGDTPISLAATEGHVDVCKFLMEKNVRMSGLAILDTTVFVDTFKKLIKEESTSSNEEDEHEESSKPKLEDISREINCLEELLTFAQRFRYNNDWILKTITAFKEEVCAIFDDFQFKERENKVVEMLAMDIEYKGGEKDSVIMGKLIGDAPNIAQYVLDKLITKTAGNGKKFNFRVLDVDRTLGPIKSPFFAPEIMNRYKRDELLKHPVTLRLIKNKWSRLSLAIFLVGGLVYMLYLALMTAMIVLDKHIEQNTSSRVELDNLRYHNLANLSMFYNNTEKTGNLTVDDTRIYREPSFVGKTISFLVLLICVFQMIKETTRVYYLRSAYLKQIESLTEAVSYIMTILFLVPFIGENFGIMRTWGMFLQDWKWQNGCVAVLFAWLSFMLYLKQIPSAGVYVWMFEDVTKTVVRVIIGLFFLICAFSFSFFVLLDSQERFQTTGRAFMKTIMWSFGEFEYDNIFIDGIVKHFDLTIVLFAFFCVVMPILTTNMLIGLAVGDIEAVRKTAFDRNFSNQISILQNLNQTYPNCILRRAYVPCVHDNHNELTLQDVLIDWFVDLERAKPESERDMEIVKLKNVLAYEIKRRR